MLAYVPVAVAVAAVVLTYVFCIRPMRRGSACLHRPAATTQPDATRRELELARTELELLRLRQRRREAPEAAG